MADDQSKAHHVEQPSFIFFIRIAQLALSILTLGLVAYTVNYFEASTLDEPNYVIFCCVFTLLAVGYDIVSRMAVPQFYNCWAQLALEALSTLFWFCGWIILAAWVGKRGDSSNGSLGGSLDDILSNSGYPYNLHNTKKRALNNYGGKKRGRPDWWVTCAVGAASSAIIWVTFMVTLTFFVIALLKHRKDPAKQHLPKSGLPYSGEKGAHEMGTAIPSAAAPVYQASAQQYPVPVQSPYPVQPTPPPQQWQQSPPPQQPYPHA